MREFFPKIWHEWKVLFKDGAFLTSFVVGWIFLIFALSVNVVASQYVDAREVLSVGDILLDNIPTYNLHWLNTWGAYIIMVVILIYPIFFKQDKLPFALFTFSFAILIRAGFILLTDIGPPEGFFYESVDKFKDHLTGVHRYIASFSLFTNDLFFSGHVTWPFLAFLIYRDTKFFRWLMLCMSFLMAITVLLMHTHYSVDVFAAYFIVYSVYRLSFILFNKLNIRFQRRINLNGWKAFKKRMKKFKEKRKLKLDK